MTTRYGLMTPIEVLRLAFRFAGGMPYPPRPSIVPGEPIAIVRRRPGREADDGRELALVRWGLLPHWVKVPDEFGSLATARMETVAEKPSFQASLRHRRCVLPADHWFERVGPGRHAQMQPVRLEAGGPQALAALWEHWLGADGSEIETAAVVTAPGNGNTRRPLVLAEADAEAWLDVRGASHAAAVDLLRRVSARPISLVTVEYGP